MATPAELRYRMPAEWEPHAATWLAWPHKEASWPGNFGPIPEVWAALAGILAEREPVHILAGGEGVMAQARAMTGHLGNVVWHDIPTDDAWIRDHGPMFLVGPRGSEPALVDWGYNAWGGKYPPYELDDQVPRRIAGQLGHRCYQPGIILEGGAVDFDGQGTVLTTEQCLLNPNRNAGLERDAIQRLLYDYTGARQVIWLGEGLVGDDTDGHIDELARFVAPGVVVAAVADDPADENHAALTDNLARLSMATDARGRGLEVIPLALPEPVIYDGQRLPASYCNFYIANGVVVAPQFDCPQDQAAMETLARLFPTRQVRGLRAVELVWGLGAFHCITQQQPAL